MTHGRTLIALALTLGAAIPLPSCAKRPDSTPFATPTPPLVASPTLLRAVANSTPALESDEPWLYDGQPGRILQTANYRLYTTQLAPVILGRLPAFLEAALTEYRSALSTDEAALLPLPPPPTRKLETFVLSTRPQWERLTRQLLGAAAPPYLRISRGGYAWAGRAVLFDIGTRDTFAIAAHEGWHQYTQRTFAQPLPVWMEEGIATYMEGHRWGGLSGGTPVFLGWANIERYDELRGVWAGGARIGGGPRMRLPELLDASPADLLASDSAPPQTGSDGALMYYAQTWALTHFLREGAGGRYRTSLERLVRDAAAGTIDQTVSAALGAREGASATNLSLRRGPGVFLAYFNPDLDEAASEFDEFLRDITRTGARGFVVAGRSPLANRSPDPVP